MGLGAGAGGLSLLNSLALQQQQMLLNNPGLAALLAGHGHLSAVELLQQQGSSGALANLSVSTSGAMPMQMSWDLAPLGSLLGAAGSEGTPMSTTGHFSVGSAADTGSPTTPMTAGGTPTAAAAAAALRGSGGSGSLQSQMSGVTMTSSPLLGGGSTAGSLGMLGGQFSSHGSRHMHMALQAALGANNAMQQQQHEESQLRQFLLQQHMAALQQQQHMALGLNLPPSATAGLSGLGLSAADLALLAQQQQHHQQQSAFSRGGGSMPGAAAADAAALLDGAALASSGPSSGRAAAAPSAPCGNAMQRSGGGAGRSSSDAAAASTQQLQQQLDLLGFSAMVPTA
jgi:hypothetical protein